MRSRLLCCLLLALQSPGALAQPAGAAPRIHIVYMGGNDCPPCVAWRARELPKLEQSEAFSSVHFSYVTKTVGSTVPPSVFLPSEVRPYKEKLDTASGGITGSSQTAIIVNDEIFDYYYGTRSAKSIQKMLHAISTGSKYPFRRCVKLARDRTCEMPG